MAPDGGIVVRLFQNGGVLDTVERLRDGAAKCADASLWALSDIDLVSAVEELNRLEQTIAAVKLRVITEIDGRHIPTAQLSRGTAAWLRSRLRLDAATARHLVDQAAALRRHPAVDAALCAGTIHLRQADAICASLDALPTAAELAALPAIPTRRPAWSMPRSPLIQRARPVPQPRRSRARPI